jgi:hypothetical protein
MEDPQKEIEKKLEKEIEKRVEKGVEKWITILITAAIAFGITVVVLKFVWAWVVPDLFPGAVTQGLINADLSWLAAFKFALLVAILGGVYHTLTDAFKTPK